MSEQRGSTPAFPLPAVVGGEALALPLILSAVEPRLGGVLLRGEKGSGKTTLARGLASLLPGDAPFVELPLGATEERVVGSLDLRAALGEGAHRFQQGLLAAAHGGVLYVDEVNLLADHLVDVLLDVAASGVNRVERDGLSHAHASRFVLVGSMNPEEGEIRPQLLDRFGLSVDATAPADPARRAEAVRRRMAFDADPVAFCAAWASEERDLRRRIAAAVPAPLADGLVEQVSALCAGAGVQGLRADLAVCRAAAALAGWEGDASADATHVRRVAAWALAHRRTSPFADPLGDLDELLEEVLGASASDRRGAGADQTPGTGPAHDEPRSVAEDAHANGPTDVAGAGGPTDVAGADGPPDAARGDGPPDDARAADDPTPAFGAAGGADRRDRDDRTGHFGDAPEDPSPIPVAPGLLDRVRRGSGPEPLAPGRGAGRATGARGRLIGSRVPDADRTPGPVAVTATVTAAAGRWATDGPGPRRVEPGDIREAVLHHQTANLVVLVVDTSGSMGAAERSAAARGAVLSLLVDAYQRRDRVALVAFAGESASVVLRPTASTEIARARLASLPTGGTTPLAAGIRSALGLAAGQRRDAYRPLLVIVTDGRATWAEEGADPWEASLQAAAEVRQAGIAALVVDCERGRTRLGLAAPLAEALDATLVGGGGAPLDADALAADVRAVLDARPPVTESRG